MGCYEYAVITLPESDYLDDMRELLGNLFDVGVNVAGCSGSQITNAFITSGVAHEFEQVNPVYVAGKSSYDLLDIMAPLLPDYSGVEPQERFGRSTDYWLGWMLGYFVLKTGYSFETIFRLAEYEELRALYWPLHEAHENKSVEVLAGMLKQRTKTTRLQALRKSAGLSQTELAKASGVGLRSIQMYEQRKKDINKAQANALFALSWALRCPMEALLER